MLDQRNGDGGYCKETASADSKDKILNCFQKSIEAQKQDIKFELEGELRVQCSFLST